MIVPMRSFNSQANKVHPYEQVVREDVMPTRQRERRVYRKVALMEITKRFPGESRAKRRAMATDLGNRTYRKHHNLPEVRDVA